LLAYDDGCIEFGDGAGGRGAYNTLGDNTAYNAVAGDSSTIWASENYWGQQSPPTYLMTYGGSYIYYDDRLTSPPGGCGEARNRAFISQGDKSTDPFTLAERAMTLADFSTAESILKEVLATSADINVSRRALVGLYRLFNLTKDRRIRDYIGSETATVKGLETLVKELCMNMSTALGELDQAQAVAEKLRKASPGTDVEMRALVHLASLRFFASSKDQVSAAAYKELVALYGEKVNPGLLNVLAPPATGAVGKMSNGNDAVSSLNTDYGLSAYPNPFNPTTVVRFSLPEPTDVTITVYDALGREVAVLLRGPQEEGVHSVQWNGRNQSGTHVASGVYFVRMSTGTLVGASRAIATQKILLMK
jgi:hypothetical protein